MSRQLSSNSNRRGCGERYRVANSRDLFVSYNRPVPGEHSTSWRAKGCLPNSTVRVLSVTRQRHFPVVCCDDHVFGCLTRRSRSGTAPAGGALADEAVRFPPIPGMGTNDLKRSTEMRAYNLQRVDGSRGELRRVARDSTPGADQRIQRRVGGSGPGLDTGASRA